MNKHEIPLYVSKASLKSFWNEYRIFPDRIELQSRFLFKTFIIPFYEIVSIQVYKQPVVKTALWAIKLDWADLFEHVGIQRKSGWIKHLHFTPKDPKEFVLKVKEYMKPSI